jgi:hypothetical protein
MKKKWLQRESNSHQTFRKRLFYPLNYGAFFSPHIKRLGNVPLWSNILSVELWCQFSTNIVEKYYYKFLENKIKNQVNPNLEICVNLQNQRHLRANFTDNCKASSDKSLNAFPLPIAKSHFSILPYSLFALPR